MRCQWHSYGSDWCPNAATQVEDVPIIGDSCCFCDDCAKKCPGGNWYPLTPERAIEEEQAEKDTMEAIRNIKWPHNKKDD